MNRLVPGLLTFGLAAATYNNVAVSITEQREAGILKRLRATPLPARALLLGQLGSSLIVGICLTVVFVAVAGFFFGVGMPAHHLPAFAAAVIAGTACFAALGIAVTAVIRTSEAAVPVVNATYIPLALISGVFFAGKQGPNWLVATRALPMRPLAETLQSAFSAEPGLAFHSTDLVIISGWTIVGAACAIRFFRWNPTGSDA